MKKIPIVGKQRIVAGRPRHLGHVDRNRPAACHRIVRAKRHPSAEELNVRDHQWYRPQFACKIPVVELNPLPKSVCPKRTPRFPRKTFHVPEGEIVLAVLCHLCVPAPALVSYSVTYNTRSERPEPNSFF